MGSGHIPPRLLRLSMALTRLVSHSSHTLSGQVLPSGFGRFCTSPPNQLVIIFLQNNEGHMKISVISLRKMANSSDCQQKESLLFLTPAVTAGQCACDAGQHDAIMRGRAGTAHVNDATIRVSMKAAGGLDGALVSWRPVVTASRRAGVASRRRSGAEWRAGRHGGRASGRRGDARHHSARRRNNHKRPAPRWPRCRVKFQSHQIVSKKQSLLFLAPVVTAG